MFCHCSKTTVQEFQADPMSFMGGSGSGVSMAFVNMDIKWAEEHGKHGTTSLARSWSSFLENGGVKAQIYDTDPGSMLIVNQDPMNNVKIKDFVLSQPHVDYYELNQRRAFPAGRTAALISDDERKQRMAQIPGRLGGRPQPVRKPAESKSPKTGKGAQAVMEDTCALQARVEALEARVQELEAEQELHELRAIVEAQEACAQTKPLSFTKQMFAIVCSVKITRLEAALTEQRRIIESQSSLIEDLNEHLSAGLPAAEKSDTEREKPISGHGERGSRESRDEEREERGQPPLPPPARRNRVSSGESCAGAKKRSAASSTSSGYGRVSTGSAGSMSAPGLRSGKLEVRKEKSERNERTGMKACQKNVTEKRLGSSSASSGGLGIKGPSPRMTPRSASASDARRHGSNGAAIAVGVPPSLPLLRQEA
eukprot:symbB.v1.2.006279.t1/scaffold363.1/size219273/12